MKPFWTLPVNLLSESLSIMRPHGARGNEGLALWFGTADGSQIDITHVVEVIGPGLRTTPLYMSLSLPAMAALTDQADKLDAFLVGQIHSHPGLLLDLSDLDIRNGIRSSDYLSVVCPYYAQRQISGFADCGVHVFEDHRYRRMPANEIAGRLVSGRTNAVRIQCEVSQ
jgi:proteasome lid subunit RPN8/RPN11